MSLAPRERLYTAFAPPSFLALPCAGIDLSTSGVKAVRLKKDSRKGIILASYAETRLPSGVYTDGEVIDRAAVSEAISTVARAVHISAANVALPESKSFLFETVASGRTAAERHVAVEQYLEELVPLPPVETAFDLVTIGMDDSGGMRVVGIGFAERVINDTLAVFDNAGVEIHALEGETIAMARALISYGDDETVLIVDIGRMTTKIAIVSQRIPFFATTVSIGGHALTLAVQKHFGVTEAEARKVKAERGIIPGSGNDDYLAAMLSTVSAIRDEIATRLEYWQSRATPSGTHEPVTRGILVGGNASVRGLPEYLEEALKIPVMTGDVFTNLASRDLWVPPLAYAESLAYATPIGLALRDFSC